MTGFSSFSRGTGNFNQLGASSISLNYQLGDWSDRFSANTIISYSKNHDFFSSNTFIEQNYLQSEKIIIKDREYVSFNSKLNYYFKFISSNLKINLGYSKSEYKNIINNSSLRTVVYNNFDSGLELRSGFKGGVNFHFGTKWTKTSVDATTFNSFIDNQSFLDLSFVFNKKLNLQLKSERYSFGSIQTNNIYYFLDSELRYKLIDDKISVGLTGQNLFNNKSFKSFSVSDIGSSSTEYRMLPRSVLLRLDFRF